TRGRFLESKHPKNKRRLSPDAETLPVRCHKIDVILALTARFDLACFARGFERPFDVPDDFRSRQSEFFHQQISYPLGERWYPSVQLFKLLHPYGKVVDL